MLPSECGRRLRPLIRAQPHAAFVMSVHIPPSPGVYAPERVDHVKLFPNRPDLRFEHRIHEQILPSIRRAELPVIPTDLYVEHRHYDRSDAGQEKKRCRDFRLLELELRERPDHPFILFNMGLTHLYASRDYEAASQYLWRCIQASHPADSIYAKAHCMLIQARQAVGDWPGALRVNEHGRRSYPEDAELLYRAGQIHIQLQRWTEARDCLERLVGGRDEAQFRSAAVGLRTYLGKQELARVYRILGDPAHAAAVLREIEEQHPDYLPAQLDLAETALALGDRATTARLMLRLQGARGLEREVERLRVLMTAGRYGVAT